MATLGHTTDEATTGALALGELIVFGPYAATENGTITSVTGRLDGLQGGGGDTNFNYEVYVDSAGSPAAKVCESASSLVLAGAAVSDITVAATGSITNGSSYWIGAFIASASGSSCVQQYHTAGASGYAYRLGLGSAPDPFGAPDGTGANYTPTYYLTYTPTGAPAVGAFQFRAWRRERLTKRRSGLLVPDTSIWLPTPAIPAGV